ncbi:hypothetical protein H4R34_001584 [Dimargaris verticillata]|uniref:Uncharacterized protein n=1 Tax=Dimargaris verticillata TaxID=2761393 RepID=A0A9W8BAG3_9FUNG|nr:hypothetical protein H4R34_001584 [Dimargaris verticillata]
MMHFPLTLGAVLFLISIVETNLGILAAGPDGQAQEFHGALPEGLPNDIDTILPPSYESVAQSSNPASNSNALAFEKGSNAGLSKPVALAPLIEKKKLKGIPNPQVDLDNMDQEVVPYSSDWMKRCAKDHKALTLITHTCRSETAHTSGDPGAIMMVKTVKANIAKATLDDLIPYFAPVFAHYLLNAAYNPSSIGGQIPWAKLCEDAKQPLFMCYVNPNKLDRTEFQMINPISALVAQADKREHFELMWTRFLHVAEENAIYPYPEDELARLQHGAITGKKSRPSPIDHPSLVLTDEQKEVIFHVGWTKGLSRDEVHTKTLQRHIPFQTLRSEAVRYLGQLMLSLIIDDHVSPQPPIDALFRMIAIAEKSVMGADGERTYAYKQSHLSQTSRSLEHQFLLLCGEFNRGGCRKEGKYWTVDLLVDDDDTDTYSASTHNGNAQASVVHLTHAERAITRHCASEFGMNHAAKQLTTLSTHGSDAEIVLSKEGCLLILGMPVELESHADFTSRLDVFRVPIVTKFTQLVPSQQKKGLFGALGRKIKK